MERPNILGKTRDTITKFIPGSVFSASDFSDISDSAKIGVALNLDGRLFLMATLLLTYWGCLRKYPLFGFMYVMVLIKNIPIKR